MYVNQPFTYVGRRTSHICFGGLCTNKFLGWSGVVELVEIVHEAGIVLSIKKYFAPINSSIDHMVQLHTLSINPCGTYDVPHGCVAGEEGVRYSTVIMLTLEVQKRDITGASAPALLRAGSIPAVVYGAHQESTPISVQAIAFGKVLREAGEATIVSLEGLGASLPTLIHEVTLDPLTSLPRHVDFYAVTKGQMVEVAIPLVFVGESAAVVAGANLVKVLHEIEVEADPMNLPHNISVDISALAALGDKIHVSDLVLPAGVTLVTVPEEVVALVQEVVEEKEEVAAPADISAIEVEKKGKEEGAEDGAEAPKA